MTFVVRRSLREINFEKQKSLRQYLDVFGIFGPNFKAIRQIPIPYQFVQRGNTRVKTKSVFSSSKGLQAFHAFAVPYVNAVDIADADSQLKCRRPLHAESPETLRKILL